MFVKLGKTLKILFQVSLINKRKTIYLLMKTMNMWKQMELSIFLSLFMKCLSQLLLVGSINCIFITFKNLCVEQYLYLSLNLSQRLMRQLWQINNLQPSQIIILDFALQLMNFTIKNLANYNKKLDKGMINLKLITNNLEILFWINQLLI